MLSAYALGVATRDELTWSSWSFEPTVVLGLALVAGLYAGDLLRRRRINSEPATDWWRPLCFAAGLAVVFVALSSPLDLGADSYLLMLHMSQHALLGTVAPPLLLLGLSPRLVRRLASTFPLDRLLLLAHPLSAGFLFIANMWFWHIPVIYDTAIDNLALHVTMHLAFIGTGLLFWWPVIHEWPEQIRVSRPGKMIYLLVTGFPMGLLAVFFFASPDVLYDHYETTPGLWGISPLADQQIAGLIMGAFGETASFIAFSYLFLRLMEEGDADTTVPAA